MSTSQNKRKNDSSDADPANQSTLDGSATSARPPKRRVQGARHGDNAGQKTDAKEVEGSGQVFEEEQGYVDKGVQTGESDGGDEIGDGSTSRQFPLEVVEHIIRYAVLNRSSYPFLLASRACNKKTEEHLYRDLPLSKSTMVQLANSLFPPPPFDVAAERPWPGKQGGATSTSPSHDGMSSDGDSTAGDDSATDDTVTDASAVKVSTIDDSATDDDGDSASTSCSCPDIRSAHCKRRALVQEISLMDLPDPKSLQQWLLAMSHVADVFGHALGDDDQEEFPAPSNQVFPNLRRVNMTANHLYERARRLVWEQQVPEAKGHQWNDGWLAHQSHGYGELYRMLTYALRGQGVELCFELDIPDYEASFADWLSEQTYPLGRPNLCVKDPAILASLHQDLLPEIEDQIMVLIWSGWEEFRIFGLRNYTQWDMVDTEYLPCYFHDRDRPFHLHFDSRPGATSHDPERWTDPDLWDGLHECLDKLHSHAKGDEDAQGSPTGSNDNKKKRDEGFTDIMVFHSPSPAVRRILADSRFDAFRWMMKVVDAD